MRGNSSEKFNILAIDICEHILSAIRKAPIPRHLSISLKHGLNSGLHKNDIHLIVVGATRFPIRRLFLNRLKYIFPHVPILFLFVEKEDKSDSKERLRGEFLISDRTSPGDLEAIDKLREIFPLNVCKHLSPGESSRVVENVVQVITENYSDPDLSLTRVASHIPMSRSKLSRILNKEAGSSFRRLLKQVRIEQAKLMLASHKYNVKEVAARTGFSDSHYFSRIFKEVTGITASEFMDSV